MKPEVLAALQTMRTASRRVLEAELERLYAIEARAREFIEQTPKSSRSVREVQVARHILLGVD